jgi:hypothetical protein
MRTHGVGVPQNTYRRGGEMEHTMGNSHAAVSADGDSTDVGRSIHEALFLKPISHFLSTSHTINIST